ncbi:ketopantoate reductase PanE/ApbA C terminal-domain-containing protein [Aspergillus unguis]
MLARPLLRAAASELYGSKVRAFPLICSRRLFSAWTQRDDEMLEKGRKGGLSGRIHVLGLGNVGTFVAHSLASRPSPPPITLLLHNPGLYKGFRVRRKSLSINSFGLDDEKTGFDVNVLYDGTWRSLPHSAEEGELADDVQPRSRHMINVEEELSGIEEDLEPIECLILAVKAPATVAAVQSIRHRLSPDSTILFLQNGMGVIDELNSQVFPDPKQRPHYMLGIISHGLAQRTGRFHVTHTGVGTTIIGPAPRENPKTLAPSDKEPDWALSTKYLLRTMTLTPPLVAVAEPPSSVTLYQLEKLAMNSIINPLTALMECQNGELLYNYSFTRLMRLLLLEISSVICSLPEVQGIPGIESRFSPERLRWMVTQLAQKTAKNHSSMLQDLWANKSTEIEYLNGYIVRRGEELGIRCVSNYMMKHLVLAKLRGERGREASAIPIDIGDLEEKP